MTTLILIYAALCIAITALLLRCLNVSSDQHVRDKYPNAYRSSSK